MNTQHRRPGMTPVERAVCAARLFYLGTQKEAQARGTRDWSDAAFLFERACDEWTTAAENPTARPVLRDVWQIRARAAHQKHVVARARSFDR